MTILKVENLTKNFGGLSAVANVSMELEKGELIGLIGPNGAGKTTLFNLLTGVYLPTSGTIEFFRTDGKHQDQRHDPSEKSSKGNQGQSLVGLAPDKINGLGVARTFQNIRLFKEQTVVENVMVAMNRNYTDSLFATLLRTKKHYQTEKEIQATALDLLEIFHLKELAHEKAKNLAYGQQRCLEIVRALATQPSLLYLDEPAAGMNPNETAELTQLIAQIRTQFDLTVVLIEHDMSLVMDICERIYVLEYGRLIAQGTPNQIQKNEDVIRAYLGGDL